MTPPKHQPPLADFAAVAHNFEGLYESALKDLGKFNLVIFGKTGAGKSTLINAMFGEDVAKVGNGRPVTLNTQYFEHPNGYMGIYDSQGIEVGEEGDKILERLREIIVEKRKGPVEEQIHVVWYCVRGGDRRLDDGQAEFIRRLADEGLPVMFVFSQVEKRDGIILPAVEETATSVRDRDLPLAADGQLFFTKAAGDSFTGFEAHGLRELLDATFQVAPDSVRKALNAAQKVDLERKAKAAREWVKGAAASAALAGATPIPFADAGLLVPIQVAMLAKISVTFGLGVPKKTLAALVAAALTAGGLTNAGKYLAVSLLKAIPGGNIVGGAIRAGVASTLTYAVGEAWIAVCGQLHKLGPAAAGELPADVIQQMFQTEFKRTAAGMRPSK
jgi:uncharacterized protein (DUF697 family)/GTP-binding protein EngB required for normal cell division